MTDDITWVGSMPEAYDRALVPALFAPYAEHVAELARGLAPRSVLELAAGTGVATAAMVRALPEATVVATDLNAAMVAWGMQRVSGATWRQADAQRLDEPDSAYDLVLCQFGAMFFPDRRAAYAEAARVLTADGTLLMSIWDTAESSDFPRVLAEALTAVLPDDPPTFVARTPHGYADPREIERDLVAGGLPQADVDRLVLRGTANSAADLAEGFCRGTPLRFELEARGSLDELTRRVADEMTARLGAGQVTGDLAGFIVTARAR